MSTSAHTPGPWTIKQDGDDYVLEGAPSPISEAYPSGIRGRVFSIRRGVIPMPQDARLIAAAPRMLARIQHLVALLDKTSIDDTMFCALNDWLDTHRETMKRMSGPGAFHASKADAQTVLVWQALSTFLGIALDAEQDRATIAAASGL